MLRLGAHESIAGGVSKAFDRAESVGCDAMQIFTKNNNRWSAKPLDPKEIERFHKRQEETGIRPVVAHDSYLINLGTPKDDLWEKSIAAFIDELERAEALGIPYLVMHPGSHTGSGEEAGLRRIAEGLDRAHAATEGFRVMTLTEITAGQGTNLGYTFEQLAAIRAMIDHPERVGICFDTCHALAAGYEFRDRESYERMWDEFDRIIGLERLKVFHLNDSQKDVGSHVDRHAHIGHGMLGLDPFRMILNVPRFDGLPGLLETPKSKDLHEDVDNLRTLRSLVE